MAADLSLSQARRIALGAQGLAKERPAGPVNARAVGRTFGRLQLVQIDSVNVLSRSHYLPFFSRLGNYDRDLLDRISGARPRTMMEYWAHEASFIRPEHFRDLRLWQKRQWVGARALEPELRSSLEARILSVLDEGIPMTAREITGAIDHRQAKVTDNWGWNWNAAKRVLEDLFEQGTVGTAARTAQFERRYTPIGSVLPPPLLAQTCTPTDPDASLRRLVEAAAAAHGIGTVKCFADYFRLPAKPAAQAVAELAEEGILQPVSVRGWDGPVYRHVQATLPRRAAGRALLSPFDSLVFERRRLQELFGFHYRIEIYTPAAKRRYGYYVLPFLLGERLVARVDLKADRLRAVLLVRSAFAEPGSPPETASELAAELQLMAAWLSLTDVVVEPVGTLAAELAAAVRAG
ncbi:winged helix-turn-helix domain-containing protein [Arthrobacter sp. A5]|uniref:winged helix-turn-helix domain-containing protein n=1 Tax=Arthrobacter sp. A5 TaxID=576926 RepID=UPI003DA84D0B